MYLTKTNQYKFNSPFLECPILYPFNFISRFPLLFLLANTESTLLCKIIKLGHYWSNTVSNKI